MHIDSNSCVIRYSEKNKLFISVVLRAPKDPQEIRESREKMAPR